MYCRVKRAEGGRVVGGGGTATASAQQQQPAPCAWKEEELGANESGNIPGVY
jgi:hypothetical protein